MYILYQVHITSFQWTPPSEILKCIKTVWRHLNTNRTCFATTCKIYQDMSYIESQVQMWQWWYFFKSYWMVAVSTKQYKAIYFFEWKALATNCSKNDEIFSISKNVHSFHQHIIEQKTETAWYMIWTMTELAPPPKVSSPCPLVSLWGCWFCI